MKKLLPIALATCLLFASPSALASASSALVIGALSTSPHAEILELVHDDLEALGYELNIVEFIEPVLLNPVLSAQEIDANYFQGLAYMDGYNKNATQSEQLAAAIAVHYAPFGLYAGKTEALSGLGEGSVIVIPDDPGNVARALLLLREAGLIELPNPSPSIEQLTLSDITANPLQLDIRKVKETALPAALKDADFAVMSAPSALGAGLKPVVDAAFLEPIDSPAAQLYADYVVVREVDMDAGFTKALQQVLLTEKVYDFILTNDAYRGGIAPAFLVDIGM